MTVDPDYLNQSVFQSAHTNTQKMKYFLSLVALAVCATVCHSSSMNNSGQSNLLVGSVRPGDRLLHREIISQSVRPGSELSVSQTVSYSGNSNISCVRAFENVVQFASASIVEGGVGYNNVRFLLKSALGFGYNYTVEVYGQ